jgi:hypothetical protein
VANADQTVGIGAGQMNRVDSCRLATEKAREHGLALAGTTPPDRPATRPAAAPGTRRLPAAAPPPPRPAGTAGTPAAALDTAEPQLLDARRLLLATGMLEEAGTGYRVRGGLFRAWLRDYLSSRQTS